jgi:hypothetical protein
MRLELLADAWDRWARRCAQLTAEEWTSPTRCDPWDVRALVAHACPDPQMFDTLADAVADEPPAVTDGAALLRFFNQPGGAANCCRLSVFECTSVCSSWRRLVGGRR